MNSRNRKKNAILGEACGQALGSCRPLSEAEYERARTE